MQIKNPEVFRHVGPPGCAGEARTPYAYVADVRTPICVGV